MALILISVVLSALLWLLYYYCTKSFDYWKKLNVPGPKPLAFFGNIKEAVLMRSLQSTNYYEIYKEYPNEKFVGIYNLRTPALLIKDLDILKNILIKDFGNFSDRGFHLGDKGLAMNIFHAESEAWSVLRKKFTPLFTSGKLKNMFYLITDRADAFIRYVDEKIEQDNIPEIGHLTSKYTAEVIGACAFGLEVGSINDERNVYVDTTNLALEPSIKVFINLMYPGFFKKFNRSFFPKALNEFYYNMVRQVWKDRSGKSKVRHDFMDLLVEMREQGTISGNKIRSTDHINLDITENVMASAAFIFFIAGYETSSTTMAFILYELAKHPDIQDKLVEEINSVLEQNDGKITYESLKDYKYLDMITSEVLRIYSIVDPLNREAAVDYPIPDTKFTIPKGTSILVSVSGIHNDPKHWENPQKFDPDRFLPEKVKNRHPMAWLPFGDGPRNCIGMRFGKIQSTVGIVSLLRKYRVEVSEKTELNPTLSPGKVTPQILGGMWLNIKRR